MESAATGRHPPPQAFVSLTEDFEVIGDETSGSAQTTPSPDEPSTRSLNISLLAQTSSESDVQRLAKEISQVSERHSSIRSGLCDTRSSLERLHGGMADRIQELKQGMVAMEAELVAKAEQCDKLLSEKSLLTDDLAKLRNKEEEWVQTREDYRKLKNNYDLLTNTKERLESEKADLIKDKEAKLAAETAAIRQKFEKELATQTEAERAKWEAKLRDCQTAHESAVGLLTEQLESESKKALEEQRAKLQAEIASVRSELDCTLSGKQRALTDLLAKHDEALTQMRCECDAKIKEQAALLAEAKLDLDACTQRHEAEKQELMEMLDGHNNASLLRQQSLLSAPLSDASVVFCTNGSTLEPAVVTETGASLRATAEIGVSADPALAPCSCGRISSFQAALERPAVQEQGTSSMPLPVSVDVAVMTEAVSLAATSDIGVTASIEMAQSAMVAVQTEEAAQAEFQVANSESLQRESAVRNLQIQVGKFAASLRIERAEKEALEVELKKRQLECEDLRQKQQEASQLDNHRIELLERKAAKQAEELQKKQSHLAIAEAQSARLTEQIRLLELELDKARGDVRSKAGAEPLVGSADRVKQLDEMIGQLNDNLVKKSAEIGSLLHDLDETRTRLYKYIQSEKDHLAQLAASDAKAEKLRHQIRELESQAQLDKAQHQLELDSARKEFHSTEAKRQAAEKEAEFLVGSAADRAQQLDKKLLEKQAEIESLVKDLDETRNKLYEALTKNRDQQSLLAASNSQVEKLRQQIRDSEIQARSEREQHEMKLDSLRKEEQFKETKLQSAEKEAEQLRQEVQRLKDAQDELNRRCRENEDTVQQVMANSDKEKRQLEEQIQTLKVQNGAQTEALTANASILEQKAALEMQLRDAISSLVEQLKRKADETDQKILEAKRQQDKLYNKLCDQSEQYQSAAQQLKQANLKLQQTEQKLEQATQRLQEVEAVMQSYSTSLEEQIKSTKTQLQESHRKRDEALKMAELMRGSLQDEHQRSAGLETELARLKLEHTRVRADYSLMEQSVTQILAKEHEMQTQMEQAQGRLRQAEETINHLKVQIRDKDFKLAERRSQEEQLRTERDNLRKRVNSLINELTGQQQQSPPDQLLDRHRAVRPSPANGNR